MRENLPTNPGESSAPNAAIEHIHDGQLLLAYIIRASWMPDQTQFVTPDNFSQQMGMIVYGAGQSVVPHVHLPIVRQVHGASEVVIVRKGKCVVDFFRTDRSYMLSRELHVGDIVSLIDGGHGFRMIEDTVLFEVKQGPYIGLKEKERFEGSVPQQ